MNLSFEWKITNVIKKESLNDLQDVIMRIVFEYKGTDADSGESYTMLGGLDLNPPSSENFTAITELTKEQVLSWLDSHPDVPKLQKNIEGCIQSQINMNDIKQATEISWIETNNLSVEPTQDVEIDPEIK